MSDNSIYHDLAERTGGSFMLGVVGPVRTGKSTFIKRFMQTVVIPRMDNAYSRERATDELPQSASGKTIMTVEPKFVPEEPAEICLPDDTRLCVRLIDCVGYMVEGASGQFEEGEERLVTTPWVDHEVTMTEAAEIGTEKVIRDHSSIGIVVTSDGSFGDIPRDRFAEAEGRVIRELQELGKPFAVILNSALPSSDEAIRLAASISETYRINCLRLNCMELGEDDVARILLSVLEEFPIRTLSFYLPDWLDALPDSHELKQRVYRLLMSNTKKLKRMKDVRAFAEAVEKEDCVSRVQQNGKELGSGALSVGIEMPRALYYQTISQETGLSICNDGDLIAILASMAEMKLEYEGIREALTAVRENGYGVVYPITNQMHLEEPQIVRQNGKYGVRLRASAPAIHMMMTNVETEVSPAIGGESASEEIISFLLQGFDGDVNRIWESNIFGKSLNALAEEGLRKKIDNLPDNARRKLRDTMQRMINESCSGLICILL